MLGPPLRHADGKQVAADPLGAAAAARARVEAFAGAIVVHFDVDAVDSADLPPANYPHHGGSWPGPARSCGLPAQATARYQLDLPVSEALS